MKKHIYVALFVFAIDLFTCKKQKTFLHTGKKRGDIDRHSIEPPFSSISDSVLSQGVSDFAGALESPGSGEAGLGIGEHLGSSGFQSGDLKGGLNADKYISGGFPSLHNQENTNEIFNSGGLIEGKADASAYMGDYSANYGEYEHDSFGQNQAYKGEHGTGHSQHASYSERRPYGRYQHLRHGFRSGGRKDYYGGQNSLSMHGSLSGNKIASHHSGSKSKHHKYGLGSLSDYHGFKDSFEHVSGMHDQDKCSQCDCDPCSTIELNVPAFCMSCSQCSKCNHASECSVEFVAHQCCNPLYLDMTKNPPCSYFDTHNCQVHDLMHASSNNQYYFVDIGLNTKWNDNMNNINSNISQFIRNQIQDFVLRIYVDHDYYHETWLLKLTQTGLYPTAKALIRFTREVPGNIALLEKTIKCGCGCYFIQPESVKIEATNQTEVLKHCPQRCRVPSRDCGSSSHSCLPMCCMLKEIAPIDPPIVDPGSSFTTPSILFTTPKVVLPEVFPPPFPKECPLSCHNVCDQICPQMCCHDDQIPHYKNFKRQQIEPAS